MFRTGSITILILTLAYHVTSDHPGDECYCLKIELSGLRGALHMETATVDGERVYLVAEQVGVIYKYNPNANGQKLTTFINITDLIEVDPGKQFEHNGLLGFAVHPNYSVNKMLYVYSVRKVNDKTYLVISEIMHNEVNGEKILLLVEKAGDERNGGQLLFGLDGYLYAFIGDGLDNTLPLTMEAQDGGNLLGKVLRLDVDKLTVGDYKLQYYDIPQDNPQLAGWRPEVYARGFRNPWRCAVDKEESRGRIFCGDLGSTVMDEISIIEKGGNYGYPLKEGDTCIGNETLCANIEDEVLPIYSFNRSAGPISAVIGGPIYRGSEFTSLQRQLVIGDYLSGLLYSLEETVAADNTSQWTLHNFTECEASKCGCNYQSHRLQHLLSIATTFSDELILMMTDSMTPGDPNTVVLSLAKEDSSGQTCGVGGLVPNSLSWMLVLVFLSMHMFTRD